MEWIYVTENRRWLGPRLGTVVGKYRVVGDKIRVSGGHDRG